MLVFCTNVIGKASRPRTKANEKFNINSEVRLKLKNRNPKAFTLCIIGSLIKMIFYNIRGDSSIIKLPINNRINLKVLVE